MLRISYLKKKSQLHDLPIPLSGANPRELNNVYIPKLLCTQVFIEALLIIVKSGDNPKVHQLMNE